MSKLMMGIGFQILLIFSLSLNPAWALVQHASGSTILPDGKYESMVIKSLTNLNSFSAVATVPIRLMPQSGQTVRFQLTAIDNSLYTQPQAGIEIAYGLVTLSDNHSRTGTTNVWNVILFAGNATSVKYTTVRVNPGTPVIMKYSNTQGIVTVSATINGQTFKLSKMAEGKPSDIQLNMMTARITQCDLAPFNDPFVLTNLKINGTSTYPNWLLKPYDGLTSNCGFYLVPQVSPAPPGAAIGTNF